jgi:uncharacterized protein YyaL (SSP411 family)
MPERPPNRLIHTTSPYLLQHAHNPVDWHPWGPEALAKARAEDKPIFLSIGYSACHWCHVMERESFEDETVAAALNGSFVPIKVDREERPDLDELYMGAVQAITGRGGWPMSVWLTPDLKPFFGGTYFPPTPKYGSPAFLQVLDGIRRAWAERRQDLEGDAKHLAEAMAGSAQVEAGADLPGEAAFQGALNQLRKAFDGRWGGFGSAPKFPQVMAAMLLFRRGSDPDRAMAVRTLDAMWEGGMFDHLGGGFARYSVDTQWLVPHFEKMLYDNAQLATGYLGAFQATGLARYGEIARETLDYLLRDLVDLAGGFHSSEDADSEGEEGKFYVFTPAEVEAVLGTEEGARFCAAYGITLQGNFEHGASVPHRFSAPAGTDFMALAPQRHQLKALRDTRVRPAKDDKVIAAWNGLTLTALARGYQVLGDRRYLEAATALATFLHRDLWMDGVLLRTWRRGEAHTPGFLEDYGAVASGLVDLYEAGFDAVWLRWAGELGGILLARFEDPEQGGFFSTAEGAEELLFRQKPLYDGALPSGNTLAAGALLRLARHLDRPAFQASAEGALRCASPLLERAPTGFLGLLSVLDLALAEPLEIVVAGPPGDPRTQALLREATRPWLPNATLSLVAAAPDLPLHQGRDPRVPGAYVCRNRVCAAPVTQPEELAALLQEFPSGPRG